MTIYVSSKVKWAPMWCVCRDAGFNINSSWIDYGTDPALLPPDLAQRCVKEAADADVLILFCEPGDVLKGALIEVGAALASWKEVRCVGDCESINPMWRGHPLWTTYHSVVEALKAPTITATLDDLAPIRDDLVAYLEIARLTFERSMCIGDDLDISDEEVERLRVRIRAWATQSETLPWPKSN